MGVSKEFLDSLSSGTVDTQTGLQGDPKSPKVKSNLSSDEINAVINNPIPDNTVGRGTLDLDYNQFKNYGGMPTGTDLTEYRGLNQSVGEQAAFGLGRLVGTTATKFLTGLGYMGSAIPAIIKGDMSTMLDNSWSEVVANGEEYLKQELLPIHHRRKYLDGNILNQMGTFSFWMDDVVDGAAFMASALVGAKGIDKLGSAVGAYGKLARSMSKGLRAAKLGKITPSNAALAKTAKALDFATINLYNSATEAAFEAKEVKDAVLNGLQRDIDDGKITEQEANERASMAARNTFGWNVAALMPSNAVTNSMMFKKFDFISSKLGGIAGLGKEVKPLTFAKKAGVFGKEALISMASEGAYEENIQLAVSDYYNDVASGFENPEFGESVAGVVKNTITNFSTDEGQKNIALGAIIGLIPGGVGGVRSAREENRRQMAIQSSFKNFLNSDKDSMLSYYKKKPSVDPETGKQVLDNAGNPVFENSILTKDGKPVLDAERIQQDFANMYANYSDFAASLKASNSGHKTLFDYIKNKHVAKTASGFYHLDGGIESFEEWVDARAQEELEELSKLGDEVDSQAIEDIKDQYKAAGKRYFNYLTQIDNNFAGIADLPNTKEGNAFRNNLKAEQFYRAVEQDFWRGQLREFTEAFEVAESEGRTKEANTIATRIDEVNNILTESEAASREVFNIETQKKKFESEQEEIKNAQEGKGAVDSDLKEETIDVTPEQQETQTEEGSTQVSTPETDTKTVRTPNHVVETSPRTFSRASKFTESTANSNGYQVDDSSINPEYDIEQGNRATLSNNFGNVKSKNSSDLELNYITRNTENGPSTSINFVETVDNARVPYKSYDSFEDLNDELSIDEDAIDHGFKNFNVREGTFKLHNVEYGQDTAKAIIDKNGTEYTLPIENKKPTASEISRQKPSVYYKKDEENKTLHSIITDAEDNIVRDTYTKQETFYNQSGLPVEIAFNFTNGKISSIRARDLSTKEVYSLALPEVSYRIEDIEQAIQDFESGTEYSLTKPSQEEIISLETIKSVHEIKKELKAERDTLAEEIKASIKAKAEAYVNSIGVSDRTIERREKYSEYKRKLADERYVKWMFGNTRLSDMSMSEVFSDSSIKYVPAHYLGQVGFLQRDDSQIIFRELSEDERNVSTEYIVGSVTNQDTFSDNGITILNQVPFEFEVLEDGHSYRIQGDVYTNNFEDAADAIEYDTDGNVLSINLWNSEGTKIELNNPFVVHNIAYGIEIQEAVEDKLFHDYFKDNNDFTVFSYNSKNYAVYRKPEGKYSIIDIVTERPITGKLHATVKTAFLSELQNAINELTYNKISENNTTKKQVIDEVRRIAKDIRSATSREASKLPDESEVASPKEGKEQTKKSKKEQELEKKLEDIVSEEAAVTEQAEEEQTKQITEAGKQEYIEDAKDISSGIETLAAEDTNYESKGELHIPKHGIKSAASAVSYVWRNRDEGEYVVNNLDAHIDFINKPAIGMSFVPEIDYDNVTFWPEHPELKARLQKGNLTDTEISEILTAEEGNFNSPVDAIPIKLVSSLGTKTYDSGIYMHTTAYDKISAPANIYSITDEAERKKQYEIFVRQQQMLTRNVRKQILNRKLKGEYVEFVGLNKSTGAPNNIGTNQNLGEVLHKIKPDLDLRTVTLGVGVRKDTIYKNGEEIIDTVANAQKGNIFLETMFTANGKSAVIKLNPSKLSRQHAAIVFKAFKQAYSKGEGGFAGKYKGDEVSGNLSRLDVLNYLVYYGEDNTKVNPKDKRKKHLRSKQLWVEKASILHFGDQKISLHKATQEDVDRFITWATKNKNYTINRTLLGSKIKGKKDFKIGNFEYNESSDNYTSFIIKNGIIKTDVDQVPGTKSLFKQPAIAFDLLSGGIDNSLPTIDSNTISQYSGQRQLPLDEESAKEATANVEESTPEKEPAESNNSEAVELAYGRTLTPLKEIVGIEVLPSGSTVYLPLKENGVVNKYPVGVVKKGKSGKVGFATTLNFDHPIANYIKNKLQNIQPFAFDNTSALEQFKKATKGEENNLYFDSPSKPTEEVANKPEPKPEIEETASARFEEKPVEDQIDDTVGKKTDKDLPDTGDILLDDIGFNPINRESSWSDNEYSRLDVKKELKRLKKRLRDNRAGQEIPTEIIDRLIKIGTNRHAFAQFYVDGFKLSRLGEEGSILHEVFHRVSLGYLTEAERQSVYSEARNKYNAQLENLYNKKEFTDREVEEFLAEQYRDYALMKEDNPSKEPKLNIPQRIAKFFKGLWNFLRTWFTGRTRLNSYDIATLFESIDNGRFKYARISKENLSKLKGDVYNFEIKGKEIESIQTPEEYREVIHNLFYMLAESNRLIETDENTGRVAVRISDYNDASKIKFGNLYRSVERDRLRYNSAANNSDRIVQSIKNNTASKEQTLELKKKLGNVSMSDQELIEKLTKNSDVSARLFDIFDDVYKNFDTFKEAVEDYMSSMNIQKIEDNSDIETTDVDEETGDTIDDFDKYNKTSYEVSAKENTALSIKFLISMLPKEAGRSSTTGLYSFVDFSPTWSRLINDLLGSRDVEDMLNKIEKRSTDNLPYQVLLNKLKEDVNLTTQFYTTMQKYKHEFVNMLISAEEAETLDYRLVNAAVQQASTRYAKEWGTKFYNDKGIFKVQKGTNKVGDPELYEELIKEFESLSTSARRALNSQGVIPDLESKITTLIDLLNVLNITIDTASIRNALVEIGGITESHSFVELLTKKIPYVFNEQSTINNVLKGETLKGPQGNKVSPENVFLYESGALFLADAYAKTRPFDLGDTVYGPQGNRYYTIAQNTYMSDLIREIHNDPSTFVETRLSALYNGNSKFLETLMDTEKAKKVKLLTMSAFLREDQYDTGREYQGITDLEDTMMRIVAIESDKLAPPTPADRRFYYFYEGFDTLGQVAGLSRVYLDEEGNIPTEILDVFEGYYRDESARIARVRNEVDKVLSGEIPNSRDLFERYHYSSYVGRDTTGEGIVDGKVLKSKGRYTGRGANFTYFNGFKLGMSTEEFRSKLQEVLNDRIEDTTEMLSELGIIHAEDGYISNNILSDKHLKRYMDLTNDEQRALKSMIANFALNTMYSSIETGKVFTGDPASFKSSEDYVKRLPGATSTGDNLRTEFPESYFEGERLIHSPNYNITTFSSNEVASVYYNQLVDMHKQYYLDKGIATTEAKAEEIAKNKLKGLKSTDQTDAQTYITPEMYKAISVRLGKWTEQKEEAFQLLQSGRELTREEKVKLSNVVMQPLKMTYMDIMYKNGHAVPVFDKMSMSTLFRPMVEGTQLEALLDRMEAKGEYEGLTPIDQVKFHTAEKVGIKDRREFFSDENETSLTDLTELSYYPQKFERLRYQLVTDPHAVSRTLVGSQFKKVGIANIYKDEIYNIEGEGEVFGQDVTNAVNEILSELSNRGINQLYDDLGIDKQDMKFTDTALLVSRLRDEARKAALPDYLVESFKLDADGKFYLDIDSFPGNRKWIQNRIISLIKKAAVDLKLPGNVFIQMSDIGLRKIDKSDELKFLDDEGYLEAKVSVSLFRSLIPNFNSLTHEERVDKIDKLRLTSIGYRIPTQGQNSVYMLKIVEFLPESVGDTLILPKEGPAIGGFDFDIDKMYIIRPNYKQGKKITYLTDENSTVEERAYVFTEEVLSDKLRNLRKEYSTAIKEVSSEIENYKDAIDFAKSQIATLEEYVEYNYDIEYSVGKLREQREIKSANYTLKKEAIERVNKLKKDLQEEITKLKDEWVSNNLEEFSNRPLIQQNIKSAVENRLLNHYFGVLANRNHMIRRTTPLGYTSGMMSALADNIKKWKGAKEEVTGALEAVSPVYQLDVKSRYKFGKQGLGPFALANVHHVLGQMSDISLFRNLGIGNTNQAGETDLSQILGKDNIDITEWFSGLIDAHVDIAADPYVYYLNVNDLTRDVVTLLIRAGVGGMTTFKFTAQPILSDISTKLSNRGNKLGVGSYTIEEDVREEYERTMFELGGENFTPVSFTENMLKDIVSEGNLEFLLTHNNNRSADWYNKQLLVLDAFNYLNSYAKYLTEATLTSRIDTKKFGSSFSEVISFKNRIFKAYQDMDKGLGIKNYGNLMEGTYLSALADNSINVIDSVLSDIILEATPSFSMFVDNILRLTGNYYTLDERVIPNIVDEIYSNIYGEFFQEYGLNRKKASSMLHGNESMAKRIADIRAGKTFPRLKNNRLIRMLEPVYGADRPDFLAVFKPDNKWYRDDISTAWREIFRGSKAEKDFAVELMYYAYLTSGFKGTVNSFHDLIPAEVIKYSGLDGFIKNKQQQLNQTDTYFNNSLDNFFRNTWTSDSLVPTASIDPSSSIITNGVTVAAKIEESKFLRGWNKEGDPIYAPYIKAGKKAPVLMKYIGYDSESQAGIYVAVNKKGYRKDGFVVKENSYDETLFQSNKLNISDRVAGMLTSDTFTNLINNLKGAKKRMYLNYVPVEDNKQLVSKMKGSIPATSSQSMQERAYRVLNLSSETLSQVNEGGQVTLESTDLEGMWILPDNKIVDLTKVEGSTYLVSEIGYQAPNNEEVNRRIKEC